MEKIVFSHAVAACTLTDKSTWKRKGNCGCGIYQVQAAHFGQLFSLLLQHLCAHPPDAVHHALNLPTSRFEGYEVVVVFLGVARQSLLSQPQEGAARKGPRLPQLSRGFKKSLPATSFVTVAPTLFSSSFHSCCLAQTSVACHSFLHIH